MQKSCMCAWTYYETLMPMRFCSKSMTIPRDPFQNPGKSNLQSPFKPCSHSSPQPPLPVYYKHSFENTGDARQQIPVVPPNNIHSQDTTKDMNIRHMGTHCSRSHATMHSWAPISLFHHSALMYDLNNTCCFMHHTIHLAPTQANALLYTAQGTPQYIPSSLSTACSI